MKFILSISTRKTFKAWLSTGESPPPRHLPCPDMLVKTAADNKVIHRQIGKIIQSIRTAEEQLANTIKNSRHNFSSTQIKTLEDEISVAITTWHKAVPHTEQTGFWHTQTNIFLFIVGYHILFFSQASLIAAVNWNYPELLHSFNSDDVKRMKLLKPKITSQSNLPWIVITQWIWKASAFSRGINTYFPNSIRLGIVY